MRSLRVLSSLLFGASVLTGVSQARASEPTTGECLDASESALKLKETHRLRESREQLLRCAAPTCPTEVRAECERRVSEVNAAIPTISFQAKDASGNDLTHVKVTADGKPLLDRLEGAAIPMDPGPHSFTFEAPDNPPVQRSLVLQENEKGRHEVIVFGTPASSPATVPQAPAVATRVAGWHVTFDGDAPGWSLIDSDTNRLVCPLPCDRLVERNQRVELRYTSEGGGTEKIQVPSFRAHTDDEALAVRAKHSTGSLALDVTLVSAGGLATIVGVVVLAVGASGTCDAGSPSNGSCPDGSAVNHSALGPGIAVTAVGAATFTVGMALLLGRTKGRAELRVPAAVTRTSSLRIESVGPGWLTATF